ncbi:MAG TPA: sugar isomerase domain-containing protein [Opitutaceae bacterium]|nr:sugar isomerase domain-containing protein [Opitutaceae bacterium]HND60665.1 sugar isomerase domain-containing protein [Opitutaceae bacterium]
MSSLADTFFTRALGLLESVRQKNADTLARLAPVIGQSIAQGGVVHTFGSGHSDVIAREIIGRAGGLVCVNGIIDPTGGFIENLVGYGTTLAERYDRQYQLLPGETMIVISNSGKNSSPLEVALYAKKKGLNIVGVTSVAMSSTYATVHPGGKNLHAVADYVLDNGGVPGDAIVDVGPGLRAGPTSTLTSALLLNLLMLEVTGWLQANGHPLPVLVSQNLPGSIERNRELGQKYRHRLSRQLT